MEKQTTEEEDMKSRAREAKLEKLQGCEVCFGGGHAEQQRSLRTLDVHRCHLHRRLYHWERWAGRDPGVLMPMLGVIQQRFKELTAAGSGPAGPPSPLDLEEQMSHALDSCKRKHSWNLGALRCGSSLKREPATLESVRNVEK